MQFLRVFVAADGTSAQGLTDVTMISATPYEGSPPVLLSAWMDAKRAAFFDFPAGWAAGWHPAPCRRLILIHAGAVEFETNDGKKHVLRGGDVALLEDTLGKGHHTLTLNEGRWQGVAVDLT